MGLRMIRLLGSSWCYRSSSLHVDSPLQRSLCWWSFTDTLIIHTYFILAEFEVWYCKLQTEFFPSTRAKLWLPIWWKQKQMQDKRCDSHFWQVSESRKLLLAHLAHYKDNQSKVKSKCDSAVLGLKKFIPSKLEALGWRHPALTALSISQNWPAGPWPDQAFWQWNRRFPRGFAEKPSPLSIMCRIWLLWMVNVD